MAVKRRTVFIQLTITEKPGSADNPDWDVDEQGFYTEAGIQNAIIEGLHSSGHDLWLTDINVVLLQDQTNVDT
jgi:hypothetical protein